jgi:hypothetical protein
VFEPTSRYYAIPTKTHVTADGREVAYKARRFLPRGGTLPLLIEVVVGQDDRLDLIAARTIGDPEQFWRIGDANDAMNPVDLLELGRTLRVPVPQA